MTGIAKGLFGLFLLILLDWTILSENISHHDFLSFLSYIQLRYILERLERVHSSTNRYNSTISDLNKSYLLEIQYTVCKPIYS